MERAESAVASSARIARAPWVGDLGGASPSPNARGFVREASARRPFGKGAIESRLAGLGSPLGGEVVKRDHA